jgi:hypothetical protein
MSVCDKVILGGGMVFTFFKAQGYSVGSSLVEDDKLDLATRLAEIAKEKGVDLILPKDVICADKFAPDAKTQTCSSTSIPDGTYLFSHFWLEFEKEKVNQQVFPSGLQLSMVSAGLHERETMSVWLSSMNMSLSSSPFD